MSQKNTNKNCEIIPKHAQTIILLSVTQHPADELQQRRTTRKNRTPVTQQINIYNFNNNAVKKPSKIISIMLKPIQLKQKNIIIIRVVSNTEVDYFINNNAKISQNDANLDLNPGITTPTPLYIGASRGFGGGGYNAEASFGNPVIYDLFLYNKSLTDSEVVALKYYLNNKHAIY